MEAHAKHFKYTKLPLQQPHKKGTTHYINEFREVE